MVAGDGGQSAGQREFGSMGKRVIPANKFCANALLVCQQPVKCDPPQANDDTQISEECHLLIYPRRATAQFLRTWFVPWRSAAYDRRNPKICEFHTIVPRTCLRKGGKADFVQDGVKEISGAVSGEGPTSAVGAMRAGRQSEDKDPRLRIAERGDWPPPVLPIGIGAAPDTRDFSTMLSQTRTAFAGYDSGIESLKGRRGGGHGRF